MLGCVSVVSFAGFEDAVQVSLGDNAVTAPEEGVDPLYYYFVPEESAMYSFRSTSAGDPFMTLYSEDKYQIKSNDDYDGLNFYVETYLTGNELYYIEIGSYETEAFNLTLTIEKSTPVASFEAVPGNNTFSVGDEEIFVWASFTPEESGYYEFSSTGSSDNTYDACGILLSSAGAEAENDDLAGLDFTMTAELEADTKYTIGVRNYKDESADINVAISKIDKRYAVKTTADNCEFAVNAICADEGDTITVSDITPYEGYIVVDVSYNDGDGSYTLHGDEDGVYTFNMPSSNVAVKVYCEEDEPDEPDDPEFDLEIAAHNLTLEGDIGLNFFVYVTDFDPEITFYGEVDFMGRTYTIDYDENKCREENGVLYHIFSFNVAPAYIYTDITFRAIYSDIYTEETYTIADYITEAAVKYKDDQNMINLMGSLMEYGYLAANYFGKEVGSALVDGYLSPLEYLTAEAMEDYAPKAGDIVETQNSGLTYIGSTLVLLTETSFRLYFSVEEGHSIDEYTFSYSGENIPDTDLVPVERNGMYYVEISGLPAPEIGNQYTISVKKNGDTVKTINYCPLNYVYTVLDRCEKGEMYDPVLELLCGAIYFYASYSYAYFSLME